MKKKRRIENRIIAVILCMAILFSQVNIADAADLNPSGTNTRQVVLSDETNMSNDEASTESTVSDEINGTTESESSISEETNENSKNNESKSSNENVKAESTDNIDAYYKDSKICIYNYEQLKQIGSDAYIYTGDKDGKIGSGEVVKSEGTELKYGADAQYILMNDIQMNSEQMWLVPDSFTGTITGTKVEENETPTLYDKETDTIYIYNPYQLMVLAQEESETEPVMTLDYDAPQFGMGQMIYPDGEEQEYLTYSKSHNYVLSQKFNSDKPELVADQLTEKAADGVQWLDGEHADGRTKPGQLYVEVSGKKYILIGNESQLRAIGSNKSVTPRLYVYYRQGLVSGLLGGKPFYTPYYPGDADLGLDAVAAEGATTHLSGFQQKPDTVKGDNSYLYYKDNGKYKLADVDLTSDDIVTGLLKGVGGLLGTLLGGLTVGTGSLCGVNDQGLPDNETASLMKLKQEYGGLKYSSNANYIIFRDIDLSKDGVNSNNEDDLWTPLMVSGDIKGAKLADGQTKITDGNAILATGRPVISNVNVNQREEMDGSKYIGIGFFGTVTNEVNVNNIGVSAGTVSVSNLELQNVNVQNNTNTHKNTQTIISGLTSGLGWLVGGVVDLLVGVLTFGSVNLNLQDTLSALLNARAKDPTIYATGAFAGRLVGDVSIENCDVTGKVSVSNINDRTGGFVGYTEGVTEYDGLSKALGVTVNALSSLLNAIPGLGLGDLITILLDKALPVDSLIPTGYKNVNIRNCHVENLAGTIGAAGKDYAGGFVGQQVGTRIFDCSVKNSSYSVTAKEYGGGFAGISRDAEIRGLLSDVGVELIRVMQPQSILLNCNLTGCNVSVSGENYQGGIVGAQTNSYAVNCGASGSIAVKASGSYAGGVSGISTVGWITNLGNKEVKDASLLTTVKDLLTGLLSSDPEKAGMLLSLVGIAPSAILGCNMDCSSVSVEAGKSYSGGILGGGDGVYIAESSTEYLNKLPYWKHGGADASSVAQRDNVLTGLKTVTVGENRVGGIAGSVTTANVTGLLNNTLGIGNFLGFTVHHVTVTGVNDGYIVEAKENYAGGALGEAVGGDVDTVTLNQVKSVSAKNRVGGFIGCAGPGDLAGGNGLTLNLLGLNNLLKVENLLSVAEGVRVKINEAHVNGIAGGMNVEATGANSNGEVMDYTAGGFIGKSSSCEIIKSDVKNLKEVTANDTDGFAGGFVGSSQTGGLADVAGEADVKALLDANKLLGAVKYLLPSYTECTVTYVDKGGVAADTAGGFAGNFQSGTVNNQGAGEGNYYSVYNLDHVNGQSYAGGFGGNVYSGALANAGGGISILGGIKGLDINVGDLLNLINAYIPYVQYAGVKSDNGFTVTANKMKTDDSNSGSAGGFIGHGSGVQISYCDVTNLKHTTVKEPKDLEANEAPTYYDENISTYAVTAARYAGGYIGYMDIGSAASVGKGLSVLGNSIGIKNVLDALNVVVSTIEHSNVTGDVGGFAVKATWKNTASDASANDILGDAGGFAGKISGGHIQDSNANNFSYIIGQITAGGYVGSMQTGTITNGQAYQAKTIKGLRCAGGFAGEMINGGAADLGGVNILGLKLDLGRMINVLNVFVPVIKQSSVEGYQSGLMVESTGIEDKDNCGYAGGYVGKLIGGQIWGDNTAHCQVKKLRRVDGRSYVGGFVGSSRPGSVATLNLTAGEGLLSKLLNKLLDTPADLIKVLNATVATIRYADVESWDDWGYIVNGAYTTGKNNTSYAKTAGGFAGMLEGTVLGEKGTPEAGIHVKNIRSVVAGEYAGGCFGVADVAGVANISAGNETSLLDKLLKLGRTDVLDAFRSYVYYGTVSGSKDAGLSVSANTAIKSGQNNQVTYSGTAGGFGGSLLNGSVKNSKVTELSKVRGLNSVGGFVGYSGKSGVVKADKIDVIGDNTGQLLGGALGVMDIFGSHIDDCAVTGTDDGYTVQSTNGDEQIAGGFIGYANLARMSNCTVGDKTNQKIGLKQVASGGTAGGFAGRTSFAYLADLKLDSGAVNVIFSLVNELIKALYLDKIQDSNLLKINLGIIKVDALYDGKLLHVNLLGLDISVRLSKKSTDNNQQTDLAIITIGDSSIKLPCDENGLLNDNDAKSNISVSLIKANRTKITDSNVYGVSQGYDVYAGGAGNNNDGDTTKDNGRSGGFVGFNDEGLLKNNNMYYCDVVRGTKNLVGPFSGKSELDSQYQFNTLDTVEGENNNYRIYRKLDQSLDEIKKNNSILNSSHEKDDTSGWDIYTIGHMNKVKTFETLKNAVLASKSDAVKADLNAYESPAKAVLMSDTKTTLNTGDSDTPEPSESQDPCDENIKLTINKVWKDLNNFDHSRANSITVTISRTWKDKAGKETTEIVPDYESYKIEGSIDKSKWQEVIKELPAYKTDGDEIYYYTYSITEAKVDGYTTTIDKSQDGFTFTITNRHFPGLPDTGGYGSYLIYLIAALLFLIYFVMRYKKCKENKKAEKL